VLNSIDTRLIADMRTAIAEVAGNSDARALLITGAGRGFCAAPILPRKDSARTACPSVRAWHMA
jgi:hypothetical protein